MVNIFRRCVGRAARLAALALLIAAPCASAAERFASPSGKGTACTQPAPCDVITAVNSAATGDDITIEPGTYGSPTPLALTLDDEGKTLSIHGHDGEPRPVIISQAGFGIELLGMNSSARNLDIEDATGQYGIYVSGAYSSAIDHVISHVSAASAVACYPAGTLTDSVCWSSGSSGVATTLLVPASVTATLRNDTLIASGSGGTAVAANPTSGGTMTINLSNSIARGAGFDISVSTDAEPKTAAIVNADHSNYATVQINNGGGGSTTTVTPAGSATNQTGAPAFVNAAAGDFRELSGSLATIDRGVDSPLNGMSDLEGAPRRLGASTDIGAYEFVPPPTCSPVATSTAAGKAATLQLACTDPAGAALTYAIVGGPAHGMLSLTAATGQVIYAPSPGYSGSDSFTYRASSSHGTAAAATVSITVSPTPILVTPILVTPILGALGERSKVWREGRALARISANSKRKRKPPVGTIFSFSLNVSARVTFAFTQQLAGRKVKGKCVAQTNKNRRKRACKRTVTRGTLSFTGHAGANKVSFQGRLSRTKKLAPGTYTLVTVATTATGRRSQPKSLSFTIVK